MPSKIFWYFFFATQHGGDWGQVLSSLLIRAVMSACNSGSVLSGKNCRMLISASRTHPDSDHFNHFFFLLFRIGLAYWLDRFLTDHNVAMLYVTQLFLLCICRSPNGLIYHVSFLVNPVSKQRKKDCLAAVILPSVLCHKAFSFTVERASASNSCREEFV